MHQFFIASTSAGIEVRVFPHAQRSHVLTTVVKNIAQGSPLCSNVANGRTCAFSVDVPPGVEDFVAGTYDQPPTGGKPVGKQLGAAVSTLTVAAGKANQLKITIGGILSSVLLSLPATVIAAIEPFTQNATVTALDPDGNVILTDAYVDAAAKKVSIAVSADSAAGTTVSIVPHSISAPGTVAVTYAPRTATNAQIQNGFTTELLAAPSNGASTYTRSLTIAPWHVDEFPLTTGSGPVDIAAGSDGNVWFSQTGTAGIISLTQRGQFTKFVPPSSSTLGVVSGLDGNMWFGESPNGYIGRITPSTGAYTHFAVPSGGDARELTAASDGSIWFTNENNNDIGRAAADGTIVERTIPTASSAPYGIVQGSDGNMWFTEILSSKVARVTRQGAFKEFPLASATFPGSITAGSDGALWFTESIGKIGRITTSGILKEFTIPTANSNPNGIVTGPDGAIWFAECGPSKIGRIPVNATSGSQIIEFSLSGASHPIGITRGPDGAVWFSEYSADAIGRLQ